MLFTSENCAKIILASSILVLLRPITAQPPNVTAPAFEVASVRSNPGGGNMIEVTPGHLHVTSATLATCIKWAYRVQNGQISGRTSAISDLLNTERYDIVAKSTELVADQQIRLMLQTLLADRFKLVLHKEARDTQMYSLLLEKNGRKFSESQGAGESEQQSKSKLTRRWKWTSMKQFADTLSDAMQAPVVDQTGLLGTYDFSLDLTPYLPTTGERPDLAAMMVTAIREQLGLRMESHKAPIDVMVIDRLEKASEN
jgi:uncharacterized protein (TIGR03435 family)